MTRRASRIRAVAALAAAVWALAPIAPMGLCAVADALAAGMPPAHCHDEGATETPSTTHDCCKKVETSCCFEALDSVATAPPAIEADDGDHDDGLRTAVALSPAWQNLPSSVNSNLGRPPGRASYLELQVFRI